MFFSSERVCVVWNADTIGVVFVRELLVRDNAGTQYLDLCQRPWDSGRRRGIADRRPVVQCPAVVIQVLVQLQRFSA
jgi:hypothetical protein